MCGGLGCSSVRWIVVGCGFAVCDFCDFAGIWAEYHCILGCFCIPISGFRFV